MEGHECHAAGRLLGDPRLHPHFIPPGPDQDRHATLDPQLLCVGGADLDRLLRADPHDPLGAAGHGAAVVVLPPPAGDDDQRAAWIGFSAGRSKSADARNPGKSHVFTSRNVFIFRTHGDRNAKRLRDNTRRPHDGFQL